MNLADAAAKLRKVVEEASKKGGDVRGAYVAAAEKMLVDDVSDNEGIGKHGAEWILKNAKYPSEGGVSVLTHCNTG